MLYIKYDFLIWGLMKVEMETSGDASRGDDVEQLEAREEAGDDHWVTSEVQGELRRGFSHRSRLWPVSANLVMTLLAGC